MFRFLAKSAVATLVWKRYHRPILATLALFIGYLLIGVVHGDYVDYAKSADDTGYLWASYLLKWTLLSLITAVYYFYVTRSVNKSNIKSNTDSKGKNRPPSQSSAVSTTDDQADPFADIRTKESLKSRGDIAINKHK